MELTADRWPTAPRAESLLDYFEASSAITRTQRHRSRLQLTTEQCQSLRDEATMLLPPLSEPFRLGEFSGVVRDTSRNLRSIDLCGHYAPRNRPACAEQYRPYIIMLKHPCAASIEFKDSAHRCLSTIEAALKKIRASSPLRHEEPSRNPAR